MACGVVKAAMAGLACGTKENTENTFPDTLNGFGYEFKDGEMRNIKTGESFQFVVKEGNQSYNQKHYEALGEVVTEEVYKFLESECKLKRLPVPRDADESEPQTFIFASEDALTNPEKLLVLIHGSGVVRAGQWARRLIINDSLDSGTQVPFIKKAMEEGYGVVVMNTNDNHRSTRSGRSKIRSSENPECHALYVWEQYIYPAKAKHIALIAHSYGGCVTTALFKKKKEEFIKRVFSVAMTDSVHFLTNSRDYKELIKISCNWVCSREPLDTVLSFHPGDIKRVSAGVTVHEQTSWSSFTSVFKFLGQGLAAAEGGRDQPAAEEDSNTETTDAEITDAENPDGGDEGSNGAVSGKGGYGGHTMSDDDADGDAGEGSDSKKMKTES